MKKHAIYALLLCVALLTGCGQSEPSAPESDDQISHEKTESVARDSEVITEEEPNEFQITLGFAGDICFADDEKVMQHYHASDDDITACIDPDYIKAMHSMDFMWLNNEFCYSNGGEPMPGKMWTFRSDPENVELLHILGVDIVGLANNHVFDYGEEAFYDTLTTLEEAEIPYVGAGRNIEAAASPVYFQCDGITIAYVAASRAEKFILTPEAGEDSPGVLRCYDTERFLQEIQEARANADYVIALPHWGTEHSTVLEDVQTSTARDYIDAGADIVIGAHSHCLQGFEFYNGKPILYSLGNFWFDEYTCDTMVLQVTITGSDNRDLQTEISMLPGTQKDLVTTMAHTQDEQRRIYNYMEDISIQVSIDDSGVVTEKKVGSSSYLFLIHIV